MATTLPPGGCSHQRDGGLEHPHATMTSMQKWCDRLNPSVTPAYEWPRVARKRVDQLKRKPDRYSAFRPKWTGSFSAVVSMKAVAIECDPSRTSIPRIEGYPSWSASTRCGPVTREPPPPFSSMNSTPAYFGVVSARSLAAGRLGSFRKNVSAGSHRLGFGGFRRRTPGPPPFNPSTYCDSCLTSGISSYVR
jgi:hypothetical protein